MDSSAAPSYTARCCKCDVTVAVVDPVLATAKNGRAMVRGTCGQCNKKICTFISSGKPKCATCNK